MLRTTERINIWLEYAGFEPEDFNHVEQRTAQAAQEQLSVPVGHNHAPINVNQDAVLDHFLITLGSFVISSFTVIAVLAIQRSGNQRL